MLRLRRCASRERPQARQGIWCRRLEQPSGKAPRPRRLGCPLASLCTRARHRQQLSFVAAGMHGMGCARQPAADFCALPIAASRDLLSSRHQHAAYRHSSVQLRFSLQLLHPLARLERTALVLARSMEGVHSSLAAQRQPAAAASAAAAAAAVQSRLASPVPCRLSCALVPDCIFQWATPAARTRRPACRLWPG